MERSSRARLRSVIIFSAIGLGALGVAVLATRGFLPLVMSPPREPAPPPAKLVSPRSQLPLPIPDAVESEPLEPAPDGSVQADAEPTTPKQTPPPPRSSKSIKNTDIVRLGPGRYEVRRQAIETALAKGGTSGARAVPVAENGTIIGYRLSGITGKLQQLGLRNGDVVTAVNGRKLTTPDAAIAAYGGLRKASRATITVRRGGRPVSLGYRIVD